jgi:inosine/xanthosine triphosphate pyrophosphatase family protein
MKTHQQRILIGTTNQDKSKKLCWLLEGLRLDPKPLNIDLIKTPLEEDATSHRGNAEKKALFYSRFTNDLVITSDGGLIIPVLKNSWDSLNTKRFPGPNASDKERISNLLNMMSPFHGKSRIIAWQEAVAIAHNATLLGVWEAKGRDGILLEEGTSESNRPGFWLHSLWFIPTFNLLYEELSEQQKFNIYDPWSQIKPLIKIFFMNQAAGKHL